jgi:tetratricopeptide (TPR) repeat protein
MEPIAGVSSSGESRLDQVIAAYVEAVEQGAKPDPEEWLTRHPDLASELKAFFADQARFQRLAAPLRGQRPAPPGTRVGYFGDYEIQAEIARGGMGVVYKARQKSLNRTVALKMIGSGLLASPEDIQRFHVEAEAAANLDDPHVVPIYEVGEFQGQHYFSMKLLEGGNLAQHIPRLFEEPREAARLLASVARTVHYAHQRGLLHRDLKPANILLDARGEPYVSDFGLAKRLQGGAELTLSGTVVGTPSYMAPEQAAGRKRELTTAADVYSLGAILYELLTGWPPFRADTPLDTLRQVTEQKPRRPRLINPRVDRDLETICLKCLEKEPQRRYVSAEELAQDLERWLAGEPIRARRARFFERCSKRPRRHTVAWVVAALLFLILILGWAVVSVRMARIQAIMARAEVDARAESRFQQARRAVDALLSQTAEELERPSGMRSLQRELREQVLKLYEQAARDTGTDPAARQKAARANHQLGDLYQEEGQLGKAEAAYRRAVTLWEKLASELPAEGKYSRGLAEVSCRLGILLQARGRLPEAEQLIRQGLTLLQKLTDASPAVPAYRDSLARSYANLGELLVATGRLEEAEQAYRRALDLHEKLAVESPQIADYRHGLAHDLLLRGRLFQAKGQVAEAEPAYHRALALEEKLIAKFPDAPAYQRELADIYTSLSTLLATTGRLQESEQVRRRAEAIRARVQAGSPGGADSDIDGGPLGKDRQRGKARR